MVALLVAGLGAGEPPALPDVTAGFAFVPEGFALLLALLRDALVGLGVDDWLRVDNELVFELSDAWDFAVFVLASAAANAREFAQSEMLAANNVDAFSSELLRVI